MFKELKNKIKRNIDIIKNIDFDYLIVPSQRKTIDFGIVNLDTAEVFGVNIKKQEIKVEKFKTYETWFFKKYIDNIVIL